jgi:hypothetical protein
MSAVYIESRQQSIDITCWVWAFIVRNIGWKNKTWYEQWSWTPCVWTWSTWHDIGRTVMPWALARVPLSQLTTCNWLLRWECIYFIIWLSCLPTLFGGQLIGPLTLVIGQIWHDGLVLYTFLVFTFGQWQVTYSYLFSVYY